MLRALGRTASLLLVTGIVAGAIYLLFNGDRSAGAPAGSDQGARLGERGSHVSREEGAGPRRPDQNQGEPRGRDRAGRRSDRAAGDLADGHGGHGGHGQFSFGRGVAGVLFTAAQLAIIAAAVVGLQRVVSNRRGAPRSA